MKETPARKQSKAAYDAQNITRITIRFSENDHDIISQLSTVAPKTAYIKGLIARDIGTADRFSATVTRTDPVPGDKPLFFCLSLHNHYDAKIIEKLKSVYTGRADYIRTLIREDIMNVSRRTWDEIGTEIDLDTYRDNALYSADQFDTLAGILDASGAPDKAKECRNISDTLKSWVLQTHQFRKE